MKPIYTQLATLATTALLLGACANAPTHIALSPQEPKVSMQTSQAIPVLLQMQDARTTPFVARFNSDSSSARTYQPSESPSEQLNNVFRNGFARAGYQIDPAAANTIDLSLVELLSDVTENTFGYEANSRIVIDLVAKNASHVLTKRYSAKGLLKGPLSPDFSTLEMDINKLLGEISHSIINDPELNAFLQQ